MDFGDIESKYSSSNLFNVVHICESGFSQDSQYRPRKSPRKRLKVARTSASLVIDQLKSVFWCPDDFTSRVRTCRNWRPEFFMKSLRDNQRGCNDNCNVILRHDKRNLAPVAPKIYSIGLHFGVRGLNESNDLSSSCSTIRNFKKRFNIVCRPMIICKYWITQSIPTSSLSTDVSLEAHTGRQTMIIDCMKSTEIVPKNNRVQNRNHNSHGHSQLCGRVEEKESDTLPKDHAGDHSFISTGFKDSFTKDHKCGSCTTRDVQIQTSNRKRSRRKKRERKDGNTKKRSKPATEKNARRKNYNYEPQIVTDFRPASHNSKRSHHDEPWLRVRVLEDKRAEYINKFTAMNRQIEEITATLRETCCGGEISRDNPENCDEYFSSISDEAIVNWSAVGSRSIIARKKNMSGEKSDSVNVRGTIGELESDRCRNVEILHIDNLNDEPVSSSKEAIASSKNSEKIPNDALKRDSVRTIKESVYSSKRISEKKTETKCRFAKQMTFDLDLKKKEDDELPEFLIENESFGEVCLKNNFAMLNNDEHAKDLAESLDLEESKYCKKINEKIGEVGILEDIKKRIDRDFDPPAERSENDTEDFLTVSQKSSNDRHDVVGVMSVTTIEESKSTPLIPSNLDLIAIHDSMSIGAMSEHSNKNSALSKYFSCTQIPSVISLTENEDELAVETVDRSAIARGSHLDLHSSYHYYDSRSNISLNDCSLSNLDSSFDCSRSSLGRIARYTSPRKFSIGTVNEQSGTFEISEDREGFAEDKICERECSPLAGSKREGKEWRAEKRYTTDSTLETSKSSRYVGSIDSGVFSSSLIDLYATEGSFDAGKSRFKKKRRARKLDGSSAAVDSGSDSSCTDDTLDRKVNDVVKDLTKNLILCERRVRMKLKARDARYVRIRGQVEIFLS